MPAWRHYDGYFISVGALLLFIGLVTLLSLSGSGTSYVGRQLFYAALSAAVFLGASCWSLNEWRRWAPRLLLAVLVLLLATAMFGDVRNGARRWLDFGVMSLQPTEFLKLAVLLFIARLSQRAIVANGGLGGGFFRRMLAWLALPLWLVLMQPDIGSFCLLLGVILSVMFLAGLHKKWLFVGLLVFSSAVTTTLFAFDHVRRRLTGFWEPFNDLYGSGYNQVHSLMAFVNGDWWGRGLGRSVEKQSYLPEAHTDFIIAIIAEEWGLLGFLVVCGLFLFLVMRALAIGQQAAMRGELFGALYSFGFAALLSAQVLINIGGSVALLPSKGFTLPLISYGGSSLLTTMLMAAVLLRVDYENTVAAGDELSIDGDYRGGPVYG